MEGIISFFASHMVLFVILGLLSLFALIGFFVDQSEQKKGISKINPNGDERNLQELASKAENKSLNNAITDAAKKSNQANNIINDMSNNQSSSTPSGFNAIHK
ncbi:MAG: hypothetical protein IJ704_01885 [Bacilli bacterium]|nr:hypothetical protein [Bacilli bacterium]